MKPKIRFKGFEGGWKEERLSEISSSIASGKNIDHKGPYPLYGSTGIIGTTDKPYHEGPMLLVARVGANAGFLQLVNEKCGVSDNTLIVKPKDPVTDNYLFQYFKFFNLNRFIYGSGQPLITGGMLKKMPVRYGLKEERETLIDYFTSLDSQISASTSRLASLKQMKAASLQAMFPQEGETVPKIRFKGFEGEWKKVMFSETFEFLKNNSLSRAELSNEGDIVNVHYGDVLIKYGDLLNIQNEELTFIADNKIGNTLYNSCHLQNGDIIIADAAEDNTVGKCSEIVNICNKRVVSGLHTIPCRPLNRFAQGYLGHYINSESYHNQLLPLIQGSKISSISKKTLSQTIVLVPSIEEQKCIGNYFTSLDRQISLQSQRLEKLKQIKSACLDKMFV